MDAETSVAIEGLGERIDTLEISLRGVGHSLLGEMATLGTSLRAEFREGFAENRQHIQVVSERFREELRAGLFENRRHTEVLVESLRDELRAEFREGVAANRGHTEVLVESLRDDIRTLADGFAAISAKLDTLSR